VITPSALQMLLMVLTRWLERREREALAYLIEFVIDLASRRVQILESTPFPNDRFMRQVCRALTAADDEWLVPHRVLICDRDAKWSALVLARLGEVGIRVVQTPFQAPNANAYAERFVRDRSKGSASIG
jgi:hypothetical protein